MRKIIALLLTVMLCLSFSSCGKNKDVIPAEDALPALPEVVGEWGSIFFSEESLLTICEDGTCTVLRQPGTWGVHKDYSLWPTILIVAQLDNGKEEQIEFYMYQGEDLGYPEGTLTIKNSELPPAEVVNRNKVARPVEAASFVLGTWVDGNSTESFATFKEDGTCEILGAKGLWGLNYAPYYNEDFGYGWDYYLFARIGELNWKIHVDEGESGRSVFSISNGPMKIIDTTEAKKLNENVITETQYEEVEITLNNWQEYFEIIDEPRWKKNAFDEIEESLGVDIVLQLKEEYLQRFVSVENGAVEVQYTPAFTRCELDFESETVIRAEVYATRPYTETETAAITGNSCKLLNSDYYEMLQVPVQLVGETSGSYYEFASCLYDYPTDIAITRIQGTLTLSYE